jgi:hypothetical protein
MENKFDFEEFSKELAAQIQGGKPLTGPDGAFTPLLKKVIEAALEGELDQHLKGRKKPPVIVAMAGGEKTSKARWAALRFFLPATATAVLNHRLLPSASVFCPETWTVRYWPFIAEE